MVVRLKFVPQFAKFLTVGVLNTVLGYFVIFSSMYLLGFSPELSNLLGYGVGLCSSYFLNRKYTFESVRVSREEILKFIFVFLIAYVSNLLVLMYLVHSSSLHDGVSQVVAGVFYVVISFLMNKYYVFKKSKNS